MIQFVWDVVRSAPFSIRDPERKFRPFGDAERRYDPSAGGAEGSEARLWSAVAAPKWRG
jgi:hypothetical protein